MNIFALVYIFFLFHSILTIQIGRIQNAMLTINNSNATMSQGNSTSNCLCQALSSLTNVVAINYFSDNNTCQFFTSYQPIFHVQSRNLTTLLLLEPPPYNPCCANLTWLLDKIAKTTEQYTVNITSPTNLYIDNNDYLVTNEFLGRLIRMNRYNLSIISATHLNTTLLGAISYNNGLYYGGTGRANYSSSENSLLIYNATSLNFLYKLTGNSSYFGPIRECRFLRNNTQMLVLSQANYGYSLILLYQINSPTNYTLIRNDIKTPPLGAYSIFTVNDTFFYFTLVYPGTNIYKLNLPTNGQNWTIQPFITGISNLNSTSSVAVDSCGRVWVANQPYINIYDPTTGQLLGTFKTVLGPYYILLLQNYELFISTTTNQIFRFAPDIYCNA